MQHKQNKEIISAKSFKRPNLKEVVKYKDLLFLLVKRDFTATYKQTVLGPLWAILQPLLNTFIFTLIFSNLANLSTTDSVGVFLPAFLFYMSGTVCWTYFSSTLTGVSGTLIANRATFKKVYFPRLIMPLSNGLSRLISFAIQFVLFLIIYFGYYLIKGMPISMGIGAFLVIPVVIQMFILSVGLGMLISSLTVKFRDLQFAMGFIVHLWQYLSPVLYGLTLVQTVCPDILWVYMLNPIAPVLTTFRYAVFGQGYFDLITYLIGWGETLVFAVIGLLAFNRAQRNFIDFV